MKVETDHITIIATRPLDELGYYVETFKADVIIFINNVTMCLTSHKSLIFSIRVSKLILIISPSEIKGEMFECLH